MINTYLYLSPDPFMSLLWFPLWASYCCLLSWDHLSPLPESPPAKSHEKHALSPCSPGCHPPLLHSPVILACSQFYLDLWNSLRIILKTEIFIQPVSLLDSAPVLVLDNHWILWLPVPFKIRLALNLTCFQWDFLSPNVDDLCFVANEWHVHSIWLSTTVKA